MAKTLFGAYLGVLFGEAGEKAGDSATSLPPDAATKERNDAVLGLLKDGSNFVVCKNTLIEKLVQQDG